MVFFNARTVWNSRFASARRHKIRCSVLSAFNVTTDNIVFLGASDFRKLASLLVFANAPPRLPPLPPRRVTNPRDFAVALAQCAASGKALHLPGSPAVFAWFKKFFGAPDARIIGGQAGNAANQLAALGCRASVFPSLFSPAQAALFGERVHVPVFRGGKLAFIPARRAARAGDATLESWIFEFAKNAQIQIGGAQTRVPRSNRLIVFSEVRLQPVFPRDFEPLLPRLALRFDAAFLSGYFYLRDAAALARAAAQARALKKNGVFVHWEYVPPERGFLEKKALVEIGGAVDSAGLNEVELARALRCLGFKREARALANDENAVSLFVGARRLLNALGLRQVQAHSLGFTVIALDKSLGLDFARRARDACVFASLVTALKAAKGAAGAKGVATVSALEVRRAPPLRVSGEGTKQLNVFASTLCAGKKERDFFLREGIVDLGDCFAVVVPAPITPSPKMTVGLGDVFSSCLLAASFPSSFRRAQSQRDSRNE
jgi:ADP-dependent phosphofructokinase/glucokinase